MNNAQESSLLLNNIIQNAPKLINEIIDKKEVKNIPYATERKPRGRPRMSDKFKPMEPIKKRKTKNDD